jgi:hypothetical protein
MGGARVGPVLRSFGRGKSQNIHEKLGAFSRHFLFEQRPLLA